MVLLGFELASWIGASFACCAVADQALRLCLRDGQARWYLIHALVNAVVVVLVVPDCVTLLTEPLRALEAPYTDAPLAITVGLHLFHCVLQFRTLAVIDWLHHLVSNMLVCGLIFPFRYGPLVSWGCLFVCGLPGGIDYFLLFLVKIEKLTKLDEKRANRVLNMWVRLPGIVSFIPFAWVAHLSGRSHVPGTVLALQAALNAVNGIYFADRVVANCALSVERLTATGAGAAVLSKGQNDHLNTADEQQAAKKAR